MLKSPSNIFDKLIFYLFVVLVFFSPLIFTTSTFELFEFPKTFFALTFDVDEENKLKIKPKAPKSGKPKTAKEGEEEEVVADFCKLITNEEKIGKSFVFEKPDFKQAEFKHTFVIEDIVVSNELKKERDFALVREKAKRKGKIIREGEIDGQKIKEEKEFEA